MRAKWNGFFIAVAVLGLLSLRCEENLTSDRGIDGPFAMYGMLSPQLDTQTVRLFPREESPTLNAGNVEADVYSIDLETGDRRQWMDSLTTGRGGLPARVFWSPFKVEYGHGYRIEAIRRSDGARSFAEVRVPPMVRLQIDESDAPLLNVFVEGDRFRLLAPEAVYDVSRPIRHPDTGEFRPVLTYEVAYAGSERPTEHGWTVTFNMIVDATDINFAYNGEICRAPTCGGQCSVMRGESTYVILDRMGVKAIVANPEWNPPRGVFDPNVMAHPEVLSNVENGSGFIAAGYELDHILNLSRETVRLSCFN